MNNRVTSMDLLSKESSDRTRMAKYCKYLDLVPNWLVDQCGREEILCNWPLRHISKKPKVHSHLPLVHASKNYRDFNYITDRSHQASQVITNDINTTKLQKCLNTPRILNEFNSNSLINSMVLLNSRKVINAPAYPNNNAIINSQARKNVSPSSTYASHQPIHSQEHIPTFGQIVNNRLYSVPIYSNQQTLNRKIWSVPSAEYEERIKRELRKYLAHCTIELGFSSPLTNKLAKVLCLGQQNFSCEELITNYERFCATNIRYSYIKSSTSSSSTATTSNSFSKPSRTLRSNTIIDDRPVTSNIFDDQSHNYCFTKRQRYLRWSRIEDNLGFSWRRRKRTKRKNDCAKLHSVDSLYNSDKSNGLIEKGYSIVVVKSDDEQSCSSRIYTESSKNLLHDHLSSTSHSSLHLSVPAPSANKTFYKADLSLPSECGYEIVFEPLTDKSESISQGELPIIVEDEAQLETLITRTTKGQPYEGSSNNEAFSHENDLLISEDIVIKRLTPVLEGNTTDPPHWAEQKHKSFITIKTDQCHKSDSNYRDDEVRVIRVKDNEWSRKQMPKEQDLVLVKVIDANSNA